MRHETRNMRVDKRREGTRRYVPSEMVVLDINYLRPFSSSTSEDCVRVHRGWYLPFGYVVLNFPAKKLAIGGEGIHGSYV